MHAPVQVDVTRRSDGAVILKCTRRDGSTTWQRHDKQARFFSFHDLHHFAVETVLGFGRGFYGLISEGWDIADTDGKGERGPLPQESVFVEFLVSLFDSERMRGLEPMSAGVFNRELREMTSGLSAPIAREFTDRELEAVRRRIRELDEQWIGVPPGGTLHLDFRG